MLHNVSPDLTVYVPVDVFVLGLNATFFFKPKYFAIPIAWACPSFFKFASFLRKSASAFVSMNKFSVKHAAIRDSRRTWKLACFLPRSRNPLQTFITCSWIAFCNFFVDEPTPG